MPVQEPSPLPVCSLNVSLPCDYKPCNKSPSYCRSMLREERNLVRNQIKRLRYKLNETIKEEGNIRHQSPTSTDLSSHFPELIKGENLEKSFSSLFRVLEALFVYTSQRLQQEEKLQLNTRIKGRLIRIQRLLSNIMCRIYRAEHIQNKTQIHGICLNIQAMYTQSIYGMFERILARVDSGRRRKRSCNPNKNRKRRAKGRKTQKRKSSKKL
ncbi:uncharacterized protein LOC134232172 [Saccostrea cucullata]|uniref:uncharacterized protein LOC134232172 n=1 Tax=Saccostrea cuccullata TaxID=36930 RepID=UPI002ED3F870